jgi:hypothetical protein
MLQVEQYGISGTKGNFSVPKAQNIPALLVPQMEHVRSADSFVLQPQASHVHRRAAAVSPSSPSIVLQFFTAVHSLETKILNLYGVVLSSAMTIMMSLFRRCLHHANHVRAKLMLFCFLILAERKQISRKNLHLDSRCDTGKDDVIIIYGTSFD